MNRRDFLKAMSAAGMSAVAPSSMLSMYKSASAATNYAGTNVSAPLVMPQVINIFLYGGPSELAGNLTNMNGPNGVEANSVNSYATAFDPRILTNDDDGTGNNGFITKNGFWRGAGGLDMQFMHDQGYLSVYRTLMKRIDTTRSHRESILMSQKGSLDIDVSAGIGTKLAATLLQHRTLFENTATSLADGTSIPDLESLFLPFVSFEGESRIFAPDPDVQIPLLMGGITLDEDLSNPFSRGLITNDANITALVDKVQAGADASRYKGIKGAFELRKSIAARMTNLTPGVGITVDTTTDASGNTLPNVTDPIDAASIGIAAGQPLVYPNGNNNRYADRIKAAVTLALKNPATLFITVGDGLGGWDDHNNATTNYPGRMSDLMAVMKAAMLHIKYSNTATTIGNGGGPLVRTTSRNIAINMFGDFGRLVNLNGPEGGWDHANNQNLYTFGIDDADASSPRPSGALGKVVGSTVRVGDGGQNNQFTEPAPGSYEAEPMSVASTVFSYFGVTNPGVLTSDDVFNPAGVSAIDETVAPEPDFF